jgi:hypothetical protein
VYKKASLVWAHLEEQHNVWMRSRGLVLEDEKLELGPRDDETVGAYCRRTIQLQADLKSANRAVADESMIVAVLKGLERERPEWSITVQGMRGSLTGKETVKVELTTPVRSTVRVAAAQSNANSDGETKQLALEAKVEQLSSQLRALQNQPQASSCPSRGKPF